MIAALDDTAMAALLRAQPYARLGCCNGGEIYVVPISFAFDEANGRLVGQTTAGKKIEMMRQNPQVCVEVDEVQSLTHWQSVILWGRYEELAGAEAAEAMGLIIDRYGPLFDEAREINRRGREMTPPRLNHEAEIDVVYAIHIESMSGRYEDGEGMRP